MRQRVLFLDLLSLARSEQKWRFDAFAKADPGASRSLKILKEIRKQSKAQICPIDRQRTISSDHLPQHMRQHLSPPGPVVIDVRSPQIQRVRNSLPSQNV